MRPDGILPDGRPFYDLTSRLNGQTLRSGESIRTREIQFLNDSGNRFTYKLKTYGKLNSTPSGFISAPDTTIEAGKSYLYQSKAVDEVQHILAVHSENAARSGAIPVQSEGRNSCDNFRFRGAGSVEVGTARISEARPARMGVVREQHGKVAGETRDVDL